MRVPTQCGRKLTGLDRWLAWQEPGASVDARPGGAFRMNVAGRAWASGQFEELLPDRRIILSWQWESPDYAVASPQERVSQVRIDLIPDGDGTLMRLTHSGLPPEQSAMHHQGWTFHLDQLASLIESA
jgi:uncharacterized protein YndB with AHSA1/START domain